jgi:hypothetical protein
MPHRSLLPADADAPAAKATTASPATRSARSRRPRKIDPVPPLAAFPAPAQDRLQMRGQYFPV